MLYIKHFLLVDDVKQMILNLYINKLSVWKSLPIRVEDEYQDFHIRGAYQPSRFCTTLYNDVYIIDYKKMKTICITNSCSCYRLGLLCQCDKRDYHIIRL